MNDLDNTLEIAQLKQKISALQQQLHYSHQRLAECLKKHTLEAEPAIVPTTQKTVQNEVYALVNICDANWSSIPAGIFYHAEQEIKLDAFEMLSTPITFDMYDRFCAANNQQPPGDNGWGRENRPVINVNYQNVIDYIDWLSERTGWNCLLPSEQQWEYACRAGSITHYWYGDTPDPRMMVMGTGKTMPTPGSRLANPWDLYDMHGNVWEWTSSCKTDEYILCGGSWYNKANWLTSSARNISYPNFCNNNWGFRIIRQ